MIDLAQFARPNTATIFADDPLARGKVLAFILENVPVPSRSRVRLDLMKGGQVSRRYTPARSPVEPKVVDHVKREPITVTIQGSLSATPLGLVGAALGSFGSIVRRDLRELAKIQALADDREPVIVVAPWATYTSMAITSVDESHPGSNKVDLSLGFEEIMIIDPLSVVGVLDLDALLAGAFESVSVGAQPAASVPAPAGLAAGGLGG